MIKLVPVAPGDRSLADNRTWARRSYDILDEFLKSGEQLVRIEGGPQRTQNVNVPLRLFVQNYGLPVKVFVRRGNVHLARTDIDAKGKIPKAKTIEEYKVLLQQAVQLTVAESRR